MDLQCKLKKKKFICPKSAILKMVTLLLLFLTYLPILLLLTTILHYYITNKNVSNVDPDLDYFDTSVILPCGIDGKGVTSIGKILQERREKDKEKSGKYTTTAISTTNNNTITPPPTPPTLMEVSQVVLESMESVFGITNFVSKVPPNLR